MRGMPPKYGGGIHGVHERGRTTTYWHHDLILVPDIGQVSGIRFSHLWVCGTRVAYTCGVSDLYRPRGRSRQSDRSGSLLDPRGVPERFNAQQVSPFVFGTATPNAVRFTHPQRVFQALPDRGTGPADRLCLGNACLPGRVALRLRVEKDCCIHTATGCISLPIIVIQPRTREPCDISHLSSFLSCLDRFDRCSPYRLQLSPRSARVVR